ncbi:MAG: hypothetical protein ACOC21_00260 [Halanaerobiales bacterium]
MKKIAIFALYLIFILTLFSACSFNSQDLIISNYPDKITSGESFEVKGEYLTENPGEHKDLDILLDIKSVENDQSILQDKKDLSGDKSQQFTFDLKLDEIDSAVYFELKLVADGEYISSIDTRDNASFRAEWKDNIVTTYFDGAGEENSWSEPLDEGNQFYFALPYRDFAFEVKDLDQEDVENVEEDYYGIKDVKNRWIEIKYEGTSVYAQWRDVGPWNIYDPHYVFEDNRPYAEMGIDMGWQGHYRETNHAGLDVSPEVMKYLIDQEDYDSDEKPKEGKIKTSWRFVDEDEVPEGPWKEEVSTEKADSEVMNLETETLRNTD